MNNRTADALREHYRKKLVEEFKNERRAIQSDSSSHNPGYIDSHYKSMLKRRDDTRFISLGGRLYRLH